MSEHGNSFLHSPDSRIPDSAVDNDDPSVLDEGAMGRKLLDIESSFIPDQSYQHHSRHAPISSFNDRMRSRNNSVSSAPSPSKSNRVQSSPARSSVLSTARPSHPGPASDLPQHSHSGHVSGATSAQGDSFQHDTSSTAESRGTYPWDPSLHFHQAETVNVSSPAAAAAERNHARASSAHKLLQPSFGDSQESQMHASQEALFDDHNDESFGISEASRLSIDVRDHDHHEHGPERNGTGEASDQANRQVDGLDGVESSSKKLRPEHLTKRQSSYRSSTSSWLSRNPASDDVQSVAETYESGGATPGPKRSHDLSRIPSLGSIASSISNTESALGAQPQPPPQQHYHHRNGVESTTPAGPGQTTLAPVVEERSSDLGSPTTPAVRAKASSVVPTNTVLNQHVKPADSIRRDYRPADEPRPSSTQDSSPFFGRTRGNLTLKEQNSKIDKLSKENFDLKLKIHYLTQALQDRSDEGVKDLVTRNAQLQTDVIKEKKEAQSMKKRVKELERMIGFRQGPSTTPSRYDESEGESSGDFHQNQFEEELGYLRDRIQYLEKENDKLNQDSVTREFERRRLAEQLRDLTTASTSKQEDLLKDLLDAESVKREQAEQQMKSLRAEVMKLRSRSPVRLRRQPSIDPLSPSTKLRAAQAVSSDDAGSLGGTTLVEQLRQENMDLKRDLGAQTSMLTSRNRERERLQDEIETLKLMYRRGEGPKSLAGDSILDRSVSRQNLHRPTSRGGASSRLSGLSDNDRERYEATEAALRDENSFLRMRNQDLQKDLDYLTDGAEHIEALRAERDEAVRLGDEDRDFAATAIDNLEVQLEEKTAEVDHLANELADKERETEALQHEIRDISESLNRVVDDAENAQSLTQGLQVDLANATGEIEALEQSLRDAVADKERLEVQAESSQSEIAFLRDEQESDKIRISDLESALRHAKNAAASDKEKAGNLDTVKEELSLARDEARTLRREMESVQAEGATHRDKFVSFETKLRETTGNFEGNDASLLSNIAYMKEDLEHLTKELHKRTHQLEVREAELDDVAYQLQARETELRTHQQASRQFKDALDRERRDRATDQEAHAQAMTSLKGRSVGHADSSIRPTPETARAIADRNNLILNAFDRLAALCGTDWAKRNNIKSLDIHDISESLAAVDEPLDLAIQAIEKTLSSFRARVRNTERDIYRDFASVEAALNSRSRRLETLEKQVKSRGGGTSFDATNAEIQRLKKENKSLHRELQFLKDGAFALPGLPAPSEDLQAAAMAAQAVERERHGSKPNADGPSSPRRASTMSALSQDADTTALVRTSRSNQVAHIDGSYDHGASSQGEMPSSETRWLLRLQELERRLKNEREGRLLDRSGARKRLEEGEREKADLRKELDRMRGLEATGAMIGRPESMSQSMLSAPSPRSPSSSSWAAGNARA